MNEPTVIPYTNAPTTLPDLQGGTVTVSPSIAPRDGAEPGAFHGWLQRGVWTW